ncbi:Hsp20/alpha crystallin family protein [Candidatus Deferrimicrobium sp.]|uniref:Hsp20/alpha crystallin family protein n=1 Tax=Candidatus Deferrimicrobium sp. TaxID=3060586 RepID=UPI002EDB41C1
MSRKIGVSRTRQKSSGEVREEGGASRRTGHVLLRDLPVDSTCQPLSDIVEVDDAVRVLLEIPGVPAASVQVRVLGNRIEITGEKIPDFPPGDTSFLCLERIFGKFQRAFEVRGSVNLGEVSARMANGILVITIPKVAERRGRERRIPVTTG